MCYNSIRNEVTAIFTRLKSVLSPYNLDQMLMALFVVSIFLPFGAGGIMAFVIAGRALSRADFRANLRFQAGFYPQITD